MNSIEKLRWIIDHEIEKMEFDSRQPIELYSPVHYILSNGGKRLRPVLSLMACRIFTDDISNCIKPATALEVFHNFTLLHDDIMDKADVRRGKPTVHKKWDENTAILSGDAMVVISFDLVSSASPLHLARLLPVFNKTALEVCEGQQFDMNFESLKMVDEGKYLEMIRLKTSVLIAAAMKIGAICGNAGDHDASLLYSSGMNLGLAFQLQDDILDLYGELESFGKRPGGDILLNKKTILLVKAFELADTETAAMMHYLLEKETDPEVKIDEMKRIFDRLGVREITTGMAGEYFNRALHDLEECSGNEKRKMEFAGFIEKVAGRSS